MARKSPTIVELSIVCAILFIIGSIASNACRRNTGSSTSGTTSTPTESDADREARERVAALRERLMPPAGTVWKDGLAAVVLVDVSGSMHDRIKGERRRNIEAAQAAAARLTEAGVRVEIDERTESVGRKIRDAELQKIPYMLVIGDNEAQDGTVALRRHGEGDQGTVGLDELAERLAAESVSAA